MTEISLKDKFFVYNDIRKDEFQYTAANSHDITVTLVSESVLIEVDERREYQSLAAIAIPITRWAEFIEHCQTIQKIIEDQNVPKKDTNA